MRILFVKPVGPRTFIGIDGPDLGFACLAAALRPDGHQVGVLDCVHERCSNDDLIERVRRARADVVGFRIYTKDIPSVRTSAARLRRVFPGLLILGGGPHPSALRERALDHLPELDALFAGEAEESLRRFLGLMRERRGVQRVEASSESPWDLAPAGFDAIPGLVYRDEAGCPRASPTAPVDLGVAPMPAWDLYNLSSYPPWGARARWPYVPIQTSRGCPHRCTFCSVKLINGSRLRHRPVEAVLAELRWLRDARGIRSFSIVDDSFLGSRRHVDRLLDAMIDADLGLEWDASTNGIRLNQLDPGLIARMERAGCYSVAVAVESGSDRTLARMRKGLSVAEISRYVHMLRDHSRLHVHAFFILGYPGETLHDLHATLRLARQLPIHSANFFLFTPHPGTEIWRQLEVEGRLAGVDYGSYLYEVPTVPLDGVESEHLVLLKNFAYATTHLRPSVLLHDLSYRRVGQSLRFLAAGLNAVLLSGLPRPILRESDREVSP